MASSEHPPHANVSFNILGDAFVDIFCFLERDFPERGGDALLEKPVGLMAGGSAVNTSTHLASLVTNTSEKRTKSQEAVFSVNLQTVVNPSDDYGRLIMNHAKTHDFHMTNCFTPGSNASTGHCIVIVSGGERTFMTHRGCVEVFRASQIDVQELVGPVVTNPEQECHIHIAGYYNIPCFWGALKATLEEVVRKRETCGLKTAISLVPQFDATGKWDGKILELFPLLDFLILSETEVSQIVRCNRQATDSNSAHSILDWTDFFDSKGPNVCVIVTLGARGAVAFRGKTILQRQDAPFVDNPIDPTGAGDAFAAGFLYGIWSWRSKNDIRHELMWPDDAIREGLVFGCGVGASSVMTRGASVPSAPSLVKTYVDEANKL